MYCPCFVFVDLSNDHMHSFNDSPCLSLSYLVTIYIYILVEFIFCFAFSVLSLFSRFQLCFPVPFLSLAFICFFHLVDFVLLCSALLSSSTCFSIRCLSPSFFFVQLRLLALLSSLPPPPAFDVGLFPLVLILPPKLCQHSHIGRFFGFSCPFSPYSYTKVVTMSLLALMRMNSSERWRWNGRVSFSS